MKVTLPTSGPQTPNADFAETGCIGRADFAAVRYSGLG
jgi:hypothetical protein